MLDGGPADGVESVKTHKKHKYSIRAKKPQELVRVFCSKRSRTIGTMQDFQHLNPFCQL